MLVLTHSTILEFVCYVLIPYIYIFRKKKKMKMKVTKITKKKLRTAGSSEGEKINKIKEKLQLFAGFAPHNAYAYKLPCL